MKQLVFKSSNKDIVKQAIAFDTNSKACNRDIIIFIVDTILFVFSLIGLKVENEEKLTRALIRELGPETLSGIGRLIHEFNEADSAVKKSEILFKILKILYDQHAIQSAFKIVKKEMGTWAWIKTGLLAAGQLIAWIGSDGVAFVAECALNILGATDLIEDGLNVNRYCK